MNRKIIYSTALFFATISCNTLQNKSKTSSEPIEEETHNVKIKIKSGADGRELCLTDDVTKHAPYLHSTEPDAKPLRMLQFESCLPGNLNQKFILHISATSDSTGYYYRNNYITTEDGRVVKQQGFKSNKHDDFKNWYDPRFGGFLTADTAPDYSEDDLSPAYFSFSDEHGQHTSFAGTGKYMFTYNLGHNYYNCFSLGCASAGSPPISESPGPQFLCRDGSYAFKYFAYSKINSESDLAGCGAVYTVEVEGSSYTPEATAVASRSLAPPQEDAFDPAKAKMELLNLLNALPDAAATDDWIIAYKINSDGQIICLRNSYDSYEKRYTFWEMECNEFGSIDNEVIYRDHTGRHTYFIEFTGGPNPRLESDFASAFLGYTLKSIEKFCAEGDGRKCSLTCLDQEDPAKLAYREQVLNCEDEKGSKTIGDFSNIHIPVYFKHIYSDNRGGGTFADYGNGKENCLVGDPNRNPANYERPWKFEPCRRGATEAQWVQVGLFLYQNVRYPQITAKYLDIYFDGGRRLKGAP